MSASSVWKMKPSAAPGPSEVPPEDNHLARLVAMVDLGTHSRTYKDKTEDKRQVYLVWELLDCPMSGSKFNHVIGERYTLSLNENAHLTKVAQVMLGKRYKAGDDNDLDTMLGEPCMIEVKHTTKQGEKGMVTYANIAGVSSVPAALAKRGIDKPMRKPFLWSIGDDPDVLEKTDWLPRCYGPTLIEVVKASKELYKGGLKTGAHGGAVLEDPDEVDPFPHGANVPLPD
jgi:hypothetical protein